jgi:hypothetical protein
MLGLACVLFRRLFKFPCIVGAIIRVRVPFEATHHRTFVLPGALFLFVLRVRQLLVSDWTLETDLVGRGPPCLNVNVACLRHMFPSSD